MKIKYKNCDILNSITQINPFSKCIDCMNNLIAKYKNLTFYPDKNIFEIQLHEF